MCNDRAKEAEQHAQGYQKQMREYEIQLEKLKKKEQTLSTSLQGKDGQLKEASLQNDKFKENEKHKKELEQKLIELQEKLTRSHKDVKDTTRGHGNGESDSWFSWFNSTAAISTSIYGMINFVQSIGFVQWASLAGGNAMFIVYCMNKMARVSRDHLSKNLKAAKASIKKSEEEVKKKVDEAKIIEAKVKEAVSALVDKHASMLPGGKPEGPLLEEKREALGTAYLDACSAITCQRIFIQTQEQYIKNFAGSISKFDAYIKQGREIDKNKGTLLRGEKRSYANNVYLKRVANLVGSTKVYFDDAKTMIHLVVTPTPQPPTGRQSYAPECDRNVIDQCSSVKGVAKTVNDLQKEISEWDENRVNMEEKIAEVSVSLVQRNQNAKENMQQKGEHSEDMREKIQRVLDVSMRTGRQSYEEFTELNTALHKQQASIAGKLSILAQLLKVDAHKPIGEQSLTDDRLLEGIGNKLENLKNHTTETRNLFIEWEAVLHGLERGSASTSGKTGSTPPGWGFPALPWK